MNIDSYFFSNIMNGLENQRIIQMFVKKIINIIQFRDCLLSKLANSMVRV